jgi:acyl-CoA dehydrogenase
VERRIFTAEHEAFRDLVRAFIDKEITPHHARWERQGVVDREVWLAAGRRGLLGVFVDEEYGGGGVEDFRFNTVLTEELAGAGATGPAFGLHNDIIGPYLVRLATEEQKRRWLPGFRRGELITAIAMTEPPPRS